MKNYFKEPNFNTSKRLIVATLNGLMLEQRKCTKALQKAFAAERKYNKGNGAYSSSVQDTQKDLSKLARHTLLAYAFLKGKSYKEIEKKTSTPIDIELILHCINDIIKYFPVLKTYKVSNKEYFACFCLTKDVLTKDIISKWIFEEGTNVIDKR